MLQKKKDSEPNEVSFLSAVTQKIKRVKRPEKTKKKVPRDRSKMVAVTVWAGILALLAFSFLAVLLSINTRSVVNEVRSERSQPKEEKQKQLSIPAADNFLSGFITEYVNVKNDQAAIEKRIKNLESYMVKQPESDVEEEERFNVDGLKGDRELKDYRLYNVKEGDTYNLFQYKVTYMNGFPVKKEVVKTVKKGKKKTKVKEKVTSHEKAEKQMLLNIPVVNQKDSFAVAAVPYFSKIYDLKGDISSNKEETRDEYTGQKKDAIETFLHTFFQKYASENKEEMVYMMKKPEALEGSLAFGEVKTVKIFETKKGFEVFCVVQFKEKENNIPVNETFSLEITENSGRYYVNSFKHQ
ncbi:conjugal transfer protein [Bacillus licheniformis]|uniref:conjugal transfer protein n=1 Tax=Bacillus licheniformis TaxID=1402 RepID=UPI002DBC7D0A|nr:conjugal transfer protein [Bacillus licheniformis]MEC0490202.1 conjugal transfer protein [Bacillus licheniformis]